MWIYGKHAVKAALLNEKREILKFILLESNQNFWQEVLEAASAQRRRFLSTKISPKLVDKNAFQSLFGKNAVHQGCAVLVKWVDEVLFSDLLQNEYDERPIIFLDQLADPQNIGSILRAAAVFGARAVVMTEDRSPEVTPAVAQAASGALEVVPLIRVINLSQSINQLKKHGFWIVGLDERSGDDLYEIDLCGKFAFIIGNEGSGMRRMSKEACDFVARLPGGSAGAAALRDGEVTAGLSDNVAALRGDRAAVALSSSSFTTLNAAQAATVTLYESARQRAKGSR